MLVWLVLVLDSNPKKMKPYRFGMTWGWVNDVRSFIFGWSDVLKDGDGQTLVTVCAVKFFHLVVFYTYRLEQGVVCVCVKMKKTGGQRQTVGELDDKAVDWQLQRSSSAHAAVPTETAAHSRGEEEDVTLLWSRVSGCCIERFKEKTTAELLSAYASLCWHADEWPTNLHFTSNCLNCKK